MSQPSGATDGSSAGETFTPWGAGSPWRSESCVCGRVSAAASVSSSTGLPTWVTSSTCSTAPERVSSTVW
jgi:hypothetical protein